MLGKLFGRKKQKEEERKDPEIPFGRYSDNNKPPQKVNRWSEADNFYKEKKYADGLDAFFDYLRDNEVQNVVYERNGAEGRFHLYQGSKIVRGKFDNERLQAEVTLAKMPQPSVPVMRRLLEMNFNLYYSRFALDEDRLCMRFDCDVQTANPSKLYYGLKELATKADRQDDLLVQDFSTLQMIDHEHMVEIPVQEKEVKYTYLQKWIKEILDLINTLDADKFSGGIAYSLLSLAYRLDYLISPEGTLLHDLEKIVGIYFQKDERPTIEKNRDMVVAFQKILEQPREKIFSYLFRSKYTFAIVAPQNHKAIADSIQGANANAPWYRDNNYPVIARQITEYGFSYCQYSFSLAKVISEWFLIFMMINYADYFEAIGYKRKLYDATSKSFEKELITEKIKEVESRWKEKYPAINFRTENLYYNTLEDFDLSFTTEIAQLNMDVK